MTLKDPKNQKLINEFLIEHAPLIQKHINVLKSKKLVPPNVEDDDLHFAGFAGLMDALHKYNPDVASRTMGKDERNPFGKYAEKRIQGKMLDHIAAQDQIPKQARIRAKNLEALNPGAPAQPEPEVTAAPTNAPAIKKPQ
jgi:DNA-directed RNA polymerase specialized sigma subunit